MSGDRPEGRDSRSVLGNIRRGRAIGLETARSRPGWLGGSSGRFLQRVLLLLGVLLAAGQPVPCFAWNVKQIVDTYAGSAVENGSAVGVGVAVVLGNAPPQFFSYGYAVCCTQPFSSNTIFEIGSVTKVFTTNLLGQSVNSGTLQLSDPLSSFSKQVGQLMPPTPQVTLEELGDFTAGFPELPLCPKSNPPPGCLPLNPPPGCGPPDRPPVHCYGASDFLEFFQNTVPMNYNETPPQQVNPPAPYFYSDFSTGLLGLLLGANGGRINDQALNQWFTTLVNSLTSPLGMGSTYLKVPSHTAQPIANGYDLAVATATVATQGPNIGKVTSITVTNPGAHYSTAPPQVRITGGGGTGATATAALDAIGGVKSITVTNGGSGYVPPPVVEFSGGDAMAEVIVQNGSVVGINLLDGGSGYSGAPSVTITGGRRTGIGRDATATAHIANGHVIFISVDDSGEGYEQPIAVIIAPGGGLLNNIPIWAPAGALSSTVADMANFAAAALGQTKVAGQNVPASITAGFKIAEMPYACQEGNSILLPCEPPDTTQSGLAWSIEPAADTEVPVPAVVSKNGGVPGFSTEVDLMPDQNLAVVVFVNTRQGSGADTGEQEEGASKPAGIIADNILFALFCTQISNGCGSTN